MALGFGVKKKKGEQEFVNTIVQSALDYVCRRVSQKKRDDWTGQTRSEEQGRGTSIRITLTHKCGTEVQGNAVISKSDFATRSETAASQKGVGLAKDLIRKIEDHDRRCDHDAHKEYEMPGRVMNVRARGNFPEPNAHNEQVKKELAKADKEKARQNRLKCPICGETDDKLYPPWGECEHVRSKKETRGRDKEVRGRTSGGPRRKSRAKADVRRAKDRAAERQSPMDRNVRARGGRNFG